MSKYEEAIDRNLKYLKLRHAQYGVVNQACYKAFKNLEQARNHVGIRKDDTTYDDQLKPFVK